jgi:CheY-like chemotaxis protein
VIESVDGAESIANASSEHPDLVFMDIQLPVLDGYGATRQIKALPGFPAIPAPMVGRSSGSLCAVAWGLYCVSSRDLRSTRAGAQRGCSGSKCIRQTLQRMRRAAVTVRGGTWALPPDAFRSAGRLFFPVGDRNPMTGFRLARNP